MKFSLIAKPCELKRFRNNCTPGLFQKLYEIGVMKIWNWSNAQPFQHHLYDGFFFHSRWTTLFIHSNILHKLVLLISLLLFCYISGKNSFFSHWCVRQLCKIIQKTSKSVRKIINTVILKMIWMPRIANNKQKEAATRWICIHEQSVIYSFLKLLSIQ